MKFIPRTTASAASAGSASAKTRIGFLPPSSSVSDLISPVSATVRWIATPVCAEPVNEMRGTSGCATSAAPASAAPGRTASSPGGSRSSVSAANSSVESGDCSLGLMTTALPAISAGPDFRHE